MRILVAQPDADAPPGLLARPLVDAGADLEQWNPRFDPVPAGPFDGIVVLGSESNPDDDRFEPWMGALRGEVAGALEIDIPILGVCFGAQILAEQAGGSTERMDDAEIAWIEIRPVVESTDDLLMRALPDEGVHMLAWHRYAITLPPSAVRVAESTVCEQAFRLPGRNAWGVQFHFEADSAIIADWLDSASELLAGGDVDAAGIRAGLDRFGEESAAVACRIGAGFADAVQRHSTG